ncbi:MAG: substrate-binding domain-containing protein [Armatimonadota bacterium]|nr:substrate-binding domain-containing protein [bacterium]MDW8320970.1 substrate-binding domain-containing protein [Armatimonadota bacterium]
MPKWKEIAESVLADVREGRLRPGDRLPSDSVLAQQWRVSRMTAHRAMQELQRLGVIARKRRSGTEVVAPERKRTGFVAVVFPHTNDLLEINYRRGISAAIPDEVHIISCDTHDDPTREAAYLKRMLHEADGIIWFPTCAPQNNTLFQRITETKTPVVCIDKAPEGVQVDLVATDNYTSSLHALRALVQTGHRHIAHFTQHDVWVSSVRERYQAFADALADLGDDDVQRWVRHFPIAQGMEREHLIQLATDALYALTHQQPPITAVFCLNDYHLMATLEACARLEIRVPEQLQILSFNDSLPLLPSIERSVHRIVQNAVTIGKLAAERLLRRMDGEVMEQRVIHVPAQFYPAEISGTLLQQRTL